MSWETKTHKLEYPVTVGEGDDAVKITKVTLSVPKGKEVRQISRVMSRAQLQSLDYSDGDATMDCIQLMSDMPEGGIDELHARDITILGELVEPFLETVMGGGPLPDNSPDGSAKTSTK